MEPGDLFGEMPLFDGLGRSAEARRSSRRRSSRSRMRPSWRFTRRTPTNCGPSSGCLQAGCGRWTRASPTPSSLTSRAAPPSVFSNLLTTATNSLSDHAGGARRNGRCQPRAGQQGNRLVRAARMARAERSALRHHQPRTALDPQPLARADGSNRNRRCERRGTQELEPVDLDIGTRGTIARRNPIRAAS